MKLEFTKKHEWGEFWTEQCKLQMREVFEEYKVFFPVEDRRQQQAEQSTGDAEASEPVNIEDLMLQHKYKWLKKRTEDWEQVDELQRYLEQNPVLVKDLLTWWKDKQAEFPVLAAIAKEYLVIPGIRILGTYCTFPF